MHTEFASVQHPYMKHAVLNPSPPTLPPGPTVIIDQVFDQEAGAPVPEDPSTSCLVYPLAGSYCIFDGRLGHGVLDSFAGSERATLLVNWWSHQPQVWGGGSSWCL